MNKTDCDDYADGGGVIAIMMEVLVGMVLKGNGVLMVKVMMRLIMVVSKLTVLQVILLNVMEVPN